MNPEYPSQEAHVMQPPPYPQPHPYSHLTNALPPPANTVIITGGPTIVGNFGAESQTLTCPYCRHLISTKVENKVTTKTHLVALLLCVCFCWLCCCMPYCSGCCQGRNHYCPNCNAFLGTYSN